MLCCVASAAIYNFAAGLVKQQSGRTIAGLASVHWLSLLHVMLQICAGRPVQDPKTLATAGKWMPPAELVQMLTQAQAQSQAEW